MQVNMILIGKMRLNVLLKIVNSFFIIFLLGGCGLYLKDDPDELLYVLGDAQKYHIDYNESYHAKNGRYRRDKLNKVSLIKGVTTIKDVTSYERITLSKRDVEFSYFPYSDYQKYILWFQTRRNWELEIFCLDCGTPKPNWDLVYMSSKEDRKKCLKEKDRFQDTDWYYVRSVYGWYLRCNLHDKRNS